MDFLWCVMPIFLLSLLHSLLFSSLSFLPEIHLCSFSLHMHDDECSSPLWLSLCFFILPLLSFVTSVCIFVKKWESEENRKKIRFKQQTLSVRPLDGFKESNFCWRKTRESLSSSLDTEWITRIESEDGKEENAFESWSWKWMTASSLIDRLQEEVCPSSLSSFSGSTTKLDRSLSGNMSQTTSRDAWFSFQFSLSFFPSSHVFRVLHVPLSLFASVSSFPLFLSLSWNNPL